MPLLLAGAQVAPQSPSDSWFNADNVVAVCVILALLLSVYNTVIQRRHMLQAARSASPQLAVTRRRRKP